MPYIPPEQRPPVDKVIINLPPLTNPGQLNYTLTEVITRYLLENKICYQTINDIKGALDEVSDEFRERVVVNYERMKRKVAGDTSYLKVEKALLDLGCEVPL